MILTYPAKYRSIPIDIIKLDCSINCFLYRNYNYLIDLFDLPFLFFLNNILIVERQLSMSKGIQIDMSDNIV